MRLINSLCLWILAIMLFLSLVSYDPMDVAYNTTHPNSPPTNSVGIIGAWAAFGCLFSFGFSAYMLCVVLAFFGADLLRAREGAKKGAVISLISGALMLLSLSALLNLPLDPRIMQYAQKLNIAGAGGMVGELLGRIFLIPYLGFSGALVLSAGVCLISTLVFTRFNIFYFIGLFVRRMSGAVSRSAKVTAEVIEHRRRVVPLSMKKVRVRPFERLARRAKKVKVTIAPPREVQKEIPELKAAPAEEKKEVKIPKVAVRPRAPGSYELPSVDMLHDSVSGKGKQPEEDLQRNIEILQGSLKDFGIDAQVGNVIRGPVITRYEVHPAPGVKVQKITVLADDLALAMAASSIRIVAPIPGKSAVGIEIPNIKAALVGLKEMLLSKEYRQTKRYIPLAIGKEISGNPVISDLREMPHLLIAGATGSGKTVCINSILITMLFSSVPEDLKLILIDPKRVEMSQYRDIPHLLTPVVTESKIAARVLCWAVREMERRYRLFSQEMVRDIIGFNAAVARRGGGEVSEPLPFIVIIIDELADLILMARKEVEDPIIRLAQMGRAAGLHIILATQRPSVNVITGLIKANFPTRIAFKVASKVDSKVILDTAGADKLIGMGDMILIPPGASRRLRIQGTLVEDDEINAVVGFVKSQAGPAYREDILGAEEDVSLGYEDIDDSLYDEAVAVVRQLGQASASMLQRRMRIGYTRAARLVDMMEERGVVGPQQGSKPREIL